jgi:hypothetical protein
MRLVVIALVFLVGAGCSHLPASGRSAAASPAVSTSPTGSPLAKAAGQLDAEVPMPAGFPSDVPIYNKARLTAGSSFTSSGQVAWGMEWETVDSAANVQAYYLKQFDQGDWTLNVSSNTTGAFTGTITRKSNSHVTGTLAINNDAGLTKILLALVSSS